MYPIGSPSADFGTGIFSSDFSPTEVCAGIIDGYVGINNAGMKNSIGYQVSLIQNFANETWLARSDTPIKEAYITRINSSGIILDADDSYAYVQCKKNGSIKGNVGFHACTLSNEDAMGICSASNIIEFGNPSSIDVTISGNKVGIKNQAPEYELDVNGEIRMVPAEGSQLVFSGYGERAVIYVGTGTTIDNRGFQISTGNNATFLMNKSGYGGIELLGSAGGDGASLFISPTDDVFSNDNYTSTSGVVNWGDQLNETNNVSGWLNFDYKEIHFRRLGRQVTVYFNIVGESNGTNACFQLPYEANIINSGTFFFAGTCLCKDDSVNIEANYVILNSDVSRVVFSPCKTPGGG